MNAEWSQILRVSLFSLSFRFLSIFNYVALSEALYMQMIGRLIQ